MSCHHKGQNMVDLSLPMHACFRWWTVLLWAKPPYCWSPKVVWAACKKTKKTHFSISQLEEIRLKCPSEKDWGKCSESHLPSVLLAQGFWIRPKSLWNVERMRDIILVVVFVVSFCFDLTWWPDLGCKTSTHLWCVAITYLPPFCMMHQEGVWDSPMTFVPFLLLLPSGESWPSNLRGAGMGLLRDLGGIF